MTVRAYEPAFQPTPLGTPIKFPDLLELSKILNSAIVEFFILTDGTIATFVITPKLPHLEVIKTYAPYDSPVISQISGDRFCKFTECSLDGQMLMDHIDYETQYLASVMQPVVDYLSKTDVKRIIFIPFRAFHSQPIHAARYTQNGKFHYLFDSYDVSYAPSASILAQCTSRYYLKKANDEALAVINSATETPYADEEVAAIVDALGGELLSLDTVIDAKDILVQETLKAGYLHICCHGDDQGLALFNSQLLTPGDIERLDLAKVRLVTLSACESGVTEPGGDLQDEYIGLPTSFLIAGAPTLIASLWKVSGISTMLLMRRFYLNLSAGFSASRALCESQQWLRNSTKSVFLQILEEFRLHYHNTQDLKSFWRIENAMNWIRKQQDYPFAHPYWWAGFEVIGWPGQVHIENQNE